MPGSGSTWNCRSKPPMVLTSMTPGTLRSCGLMIQSWIVRRSVSVKAPPPGAFAPSLASTVYMKISPRPVEIGPIAASMPGGNWSFTCWMRSLTSWRAK